MATDEVSASEQAVETTDAPASSQELQDAPEGHSDHEELQKKYAAMEQELKTQKGRSSTSDKKVKELEAELAKMRVLAGEEDIEDEQETTPEFVTPEQLEEKAWQLANAKDIDLYSDDEYNDEIEAGVPRDIALKHAKLRYQANPDNANAQRQEQIASEGSTSVRNLDSVDITDEDRAEMQKWGYTEETLLKHKRLKQERGV